MKLQSHAEIVGRLNPRDYADDLAGVVEMLEPSYFQKLLGLIIRTDNPDAFFALTPHGEELRTSYGAVISHRRKRAVASRMRDITHRMRLALSGMGIQIGFPSYISSVYHGDNLHWERSGTALWHIDRNKRNAWAHTSFGSIAGLEWVNGTTEIPDVGTMNERVRHVERNIQGRSVTVRKSGDGEVVILRPDTVHRIEPMRKPGFRHLLIHTLQ